MGIEVIGGGGPSGKALVVKRITSTQTWTAPDDVDTVEVTLVGGGGAGGNLLNGLSNNERSASGGGHGAEVIRRDVGVVPGTTYTITIGAGGSAGVNINSNNNTATLGIGSPSSFGNLLTARGGGSGTSSRVSVTDSTMTIDTYQGLTHHDYLFQTNAFGIGGHTPNSIGTSNNAAFYGIGGPGAGGVGLPTFTGSPGVNTTYATLPSGARAPLGGYSHLRTGGNPRELPGTGPGLYGYGGGGGGSSATGVIGNNPVNTDSDHQSQFIIGTTTGQDGGGSGVFVYSNNGATANFGDKDGEINTGGGGAGSIVGRSTRVEGGNGGSGVAIIKYITSEE